MDSGSIVAVATSVLTVVSVFLETKYRKWLETGRLFAKLLVDMVAAAEDDKVSEDEFHKIVAEAKNYDNEFSPYSWELYVNKNNIPEYLSWTILPLFLFVSIAVSVWKKETEKKNCSIVSF